MVVQHLAKSLCWCFLSFLYVYQFLCVPLYLNESMYRDYGLKCKPKIDNSHCLKNILCLLFGVQIQESIKLRFVTWVTYRLQVLHRMKCIKITAIMKVRQIEHVSLVFFLINWRGSFFLSYSLCICLYFVFHSLSVILHAWPLCVSHGRVHFSFG